MRSGPDTLKLGSLAFIGLCSSLVGLLPAREEGLRELHPEWLQMVEHWMQVASTAGSRSGAYAKARKLLQERLDRAPDDSKAIYHLALVDAKTGHPEQAAAGFLSLLEGPSPDHRAVAGLAYSLRYTGWFTASEKLYFWLILQESTVYPPSRAWSQITKNRIYAGRYEGARQSDLLMYEAIREEAAPLTEKHLFYSGLVAAYLEGPESALPYWEAAWAMRPDTVWSRFALAYRSAFGGAPEDLLDLLETMQNHGFTDGERTYRLVHLYTLAGQPKRALDMLRLSLDRGFFPFTYWKEDPLLEDLPRKGPEIEALFLQASARHQSFAAIAGQAEFFLSQQPEDS